MPKSSPIQTNFSGGELGAGVEGRVELEKHGTGLDTCINYIPTLEGPLVRTPGTKRVVGAKDPSKPPRLIPFKFSNDEQYIIEAGENYFRFYTDEGALVTTGSAFVISKGIETLANPEELTITNSVLGTPVSRAQAKYYGIRSKNETKGYEIRASTGISPFFVTSSLVSGSLVEFDTPYDHNMVKGLGWAQKGDTLWLMHSSVPTFTLQRGPTPQDWDLKYFMPKDGPYLQLNTKKTVGDLVDKGFLLEWDNRVAPADFKKAGNTVRVIAHSSVKISGIVSAGGVCQVNTRSQHNFKDNDKVWISGVAGTSEANNGTSYVVSGFSFGTAVNESSVWDVTVLTGSSFLLRNSVFTNAYVGSGVVYPAIFSDTDSARNIGLYVGGNRYYGVIQTGSNIFSPSINNNPPHPVNAFVEIDDNSSILPIASTVVSIWQMGAYNRVNGWPSSATFHQDRLVMAGAPGLPSEFDASNTGDYRQFSVNRSSSLVVTDTNALQFNLNSESADKIQWVKSGKQGLYFGTESNEFLVSPSRDGQALTPTNINSDIIGNYGSADVSPIRFGDAVIYLQNSQQKVREIRYFANLQSHKSTFINQLSDHIGYPQIMGLSSQKEFYPLVWGYKSDGSLISMSYSRDDSQAISGWANHLLGGYGDFDGGPPKVKSLETIRDSQGKYDQLWMVVQRYINGSSDVGIEYMAAPYRHKDPTQKQRDAYYVSCGATYDQPLPIQAMYVDSSVTSSPRIEILASMFGIGPLSTTWVNGDYVRISGVVGMSTSFLNIDSIRVGSSLVNERTFIVNSSSGSVFFLKHVDDDPLDTNAHMLGYSEAKIVNNSGVVSPAFTAYMRKLVTSIGGFTWLKNETVNILGDGRDLGTVVVNSAGVIALPQPSATVQVGYSYKSRAKTLSKEQGSATGSAIGMRKKTYQVAFRVRDMGDLKYGGIDFYHLHQANFFIGDEHPANEPTPLFTGIFRDGAEQDIDFGAHVYFEQSSPLPGMIQSITYMMDEYDL